MGIAAAGRGLTRTTATPGASLNRLREVDRGILVAMAAIKRQVPLILSQGELEELGYQFVYSSDPGGS